MNKKKTKTSGKREYQFLQLPMSMMSYANNELVFYKINSIGLL